MGTKVFADSVSLCV